MESGLEESPTDPTDGSEGSQRCARLAMGANQADGVFQPHVRIAGRGKAVQKPGVGFKIQGFPGVIDVAEKQRQSNPPFVKNQSVNPSHQRWVMQKQFVGEHL